ncbi:MAG: hypothetical protein ACL93V_00355 [Candidatus Electrothrix sp. YB6]
MSNFLLIPTHLDALYLTRSRRVVESMVDFSQLPYSDGMQDINPNSAYVSEEFNSQPFQNRNLFLQPGIHLHWQLPDALTAGREEKNGVSFPAVPDRWLITHRTGDGSIKQWVVESNFLYPAGSYAESIIMPCQPKGPHDPPYRYMGRALPLEQWLEQLQSSASTAEYYPYLTAVGYGEPSFAAFYPNCLSVFGFHDPEAAAENLRDSVEYEVIGWYSDPAADHLSRELQKYSGDDPVSYLAEEFGWQVAPEELAGKDNYLLCCARIKISRDRLKSDKLNPDPLALHPDQSDGWVKVAVGSTGPEALSAYLAAAMSGSPEEKKKKEQQFEALIQPEIFTGVNPDAPYKLHELRHEKGFMAKQAGLQWLVFSKQQEQQEKERQAKTPLSPDLLARLAALNARQKEYDRQQAEIKSIRRRTFADWYKYMLCSYPPETVSDDHLDIDTVRVFIEQRDLAPLERRIAESWWLQAEIGDRIETLRSGLEAFNQEHKTTFTLQSEPASRYWQPVEPVILLDGDEVVSTDQARPSGPLQVTGAAAASACFSNLLRNGEADGIDRIREKLPAAAEWQQQPWHPFLLEWQVKIQLQKTLDSEQKKYPPDYFTGDYTFNEHATDLTAREGKKVPEIRYIYSGRSLLTPYAAELLREKVESRLKDTSAQKNEQFDDFVRKAGEKLDKMQSLSQALSGLNDALLMHKQTFQLAVREPIGFQEYRNFTERVEQLVGDSIINAPEPLNSFAPLRAGKMRISRLRLIDTFGQRKELRWKEVIRSETITAPEPDRIVLPPRCMQPARIDFRWLSSRPDASENRPEESSNHPEQTAVCGWLMPNNLERSLAVYDSKGKALGIIDHQQNWIPAPGKDGLEEPEQISDSCLRETVQRIKTTGTGDQGGDNGFSQFLRTINTALDRINPRNFSRYKGTALLIGRPVAVVRASLNLELQGLPVINQDWSVFREDIQQKDSQRETEGFDAVNIPIRLGNHKQQNDGLLGYWLEGPDDTAFYSTKEPDKEHPTLYQAFRDPAHTLTLLMDPLGTLHITTGILPVKEEILPPEQYADALQSIEVTFLTAPVLTRSGGIELPLPEEPGYAWVWVEKDGDDWQEQGVDQYSLSADFSRPQEVREGWLKLVPQKDTGNPETK